MALQAGTPGCTKEACKFRDEYGKFVDAECEVFGISSDTTEANAAFAKKERLPFPLLTDQNDFLRKSFGIKGNMFGMLKGRQVRTCNSPPLGNSHGTTLPLTCYRIAWHGGRGCHTATLACSTSQIA